MNTSQQQPEPLVAPAREEGRGRFLPKEDLLDRRLAYTLFRLVLGVNLLLHGATRLSARGGTFPMFHLEDLPLPPAPLLQTGLALLTAGLGVLLVLGLWTRPALAGGGALVTAMVVGTAHRTDWEMLTVQTIYLAMFYVLPPASHYNAFSADALRAGFSAGKLKTPSRRGQ